MNKTQFEKITFLGFGLVYIISILAAALADVIEVDAAQYASISMEMLQNNSFLTVTERGQDYLDKPPFLFWINSLSGLSLFCFEANGLVLLTLAFLLTAFMIFQGKEQFQKALVLLALSLGFVFNVHIIPSLESYGEGQRFAELIEEKGIEKEPIYFLNRNSRAMEFYLQRRIPLISWEDLMQRQKDHEEAWYYMSLDAKESLCYNGLDVEEELSLGIQDFNRIKIGFLNPQTREGQLEMRYLIKFKGH